MHSTQIQPGFLTAQPLQHFAAGAFPTIHPIHWLTSHFAVGAYSPLQRLSGMLTAHMTRIEPQNGFTWHSHRGLEIFTWVLDGTLYHEDSTGGKGAIAAGELQRMFSGRYIEHQELNLSAEPARVIQIWFAVDPAQHREVAPHYQQLARADLPWSQAGGARVYTLLGDGAPMEQHIQARLQASELAGGGATALEVPRPGEDLFVYVTAGAGSFARHDSPAEPLGLYDVLLATPGAEGVRIQAAPDEPLDYLSFYLPRFMA